MENINWQLWATELHQLLGDMLAETTGLTDVQWTKVPREIRELIQGALELENEAFICCAGETNAA